MTVTAVPPLTDAVQANWRCGRFAVPLDRAQVMGIVNVTPDSFSDGGRWVGAGAIDHAVTLVQQGADIIDVGGESTRPGAPPVPAAEQLRRVMPVVQALRDGPVPVSVDTSDADVIAAVLDAGASIVNDVRALSRPGALARVAASGCGVVLMHMQGDPATMQVAPSYRDVLAEVEAFLVARLVVARQAGVAADRIVVDPGFGFGKTAAHNWALMHGIGRLSTHAPVLVGLSRKSVLGAATGRPVQDRTAASVAAAVLAVQQGARVVRVHDVAATRDALAVLASHAASAPRAHRSTSPAAGIAPVAAASPIPGAPA